MVAVAVVEINCTTIYKPCIIDSTICPDDQVCFQYFCYPKVASAEDPLKSCRKNSQCPRWKSSRTEKCFKKGGKGVCVTSEDYEVCETHEECEGRGGKCCGDYCCNTEYFNALLNAPCNDEDMVCKVKIYFVLKKYESKTEQIQFRGFRWFLDIKVSRYCEGYSFL